MRSGTLWKIISYSLSWFWHFWVCWVIIMLNWVQYYEVIVNMDWIWPACLIALYLILMLNAFKGVNYLYKKKRWLIHRPTLSFKNYYDRIWARAAHLFIIAVSIFTFTVAYYIHYAPPSLEDGGAWLSNWEASFSHRIYSRHSFLLGQYWQMLKPIIVNHPLISDIISVNLNGLYIVTIFFQIMSMCMFSTLLVFGVVDGVDFISITQPVNLWWNNIISWSSDFVARSSRSGLLILLQALMSEDTIFWEVYLVWTTLLLILVLIMVLVFVHTYILDRWFVELSVARWLYPNECGYYNQMRYHRRYKRKLRNLLWWKH